MKNEVKKITNMRRWIAIMTFALANGIIFLLPYAQYTFYDSMKAALELNNVQMGTLISVFGLINAGLYPLGGMVLDKYAKDKLFIVTALLLTGAGGIWMSTSPPYPIALTIMSLWAFTTTFLFFIAFINGKRRLGTGADMGKVFGLSETFSMVCALLASSTGLWIFARFNQSFQAIMIYYSALHIVAALICVVFLPPDPQKRDSQEPANDVNMLEGLSILIKRKDIWYICGLVFCSFGISMTIGRMTPYLTAVFNISLVVATGIGIANQYAVSILGPSIGGIAADRMQCSTGFIKHCFVILAAAALILVLMPGKSKVIVVVIVCGLSIKLIQTCQKGAYWIPITDTRIPDKYCGTAIGLVSFLGFLPEAFILTLWGGILDHFSTNPELGYKIVFCGIIVLSVLGFLFATLLIKNMRQRGILDEQGHIIHITTK